MIGAQRNKEKEIMKSKKFLALALAAVTVSTMAAFASCGEDADITITGSSSVSPLMSALAEAYEEKNDVKISVQTSDSSVGIQDTIDGKNDFGMASRDLKDTEKGVVSKQIATDGVALIVGKSCTVSNVTPEEVYTLYAEGTAIQEVITGGYNREAGSGTRDAFTDLIKDAEGNKLKDLETFASVINNVNGTDAVKTSIASSSNLIGYISLGSLDDTVKALTFKGVEATVANIKSGTYELKRPFNIVYQEGKLSEKAQAFIDFIMSDEGQAIVLEKGYIDMN